MSTMNTMSANVQTSIQTTAPKIKIDWTVGFSDAEKRENAIQVVKDYDKMVLRKLARHQDSSAEVLSKLFNVKEKRLRYSGLDLNEIVNSCKPEPVGKIQASLDRLLKARKVVHSSIGYPRRYQTSSSSKKKRASEKNDDTVELNRTVRI